MNKFILVPKEQFENLRENQISEMGTDSKNESALEEKNSEEGQKIIKNQDTSTKGDKIIKGQDPPPGLPNHYLEVDKKKISKYDRDRAVRNSSGGRGGNKDPEWVRFWNKNIR